MGRGARSPFIALGVFAAVAACGDQSTRTSVADASARVAIAAATISGQEAVLANEVTNAPYLGFDTGTYPGDEAMRAWRTGNSPYSWTGYYLKSPCHQDEGWSGKRESLAAMGYGLDVLYVGQQTWGRRQGSPHMERMDVLHQSMRDYYSAWVRAVLDDGRYVPGIYVHTHNANTVYNDVKAVYTSVGLEGEPPFWIAKSRGFETNKHPRETGHDFAAVWQGVLDVTQTWNGHKIPIDVNVAALPSPSSVVTEIAQGFAGGE